MLSFARYIPLVSWIFCITKETHALSSQQDPSMSRRTAFGKVVSVATSGVVIASTSSADRAFAAGDLVFSKSTSGIEWADAKVGTGNPLKPGATATIDYVMSTTGARYGTKIYSTAAVDRPYRWKLGDGSTIAGIEEAILGDGGSLVPMRPGGVRRIVIPQSLGYSKLAADSKTLCVENGAPGPIPPPSEAFEEYQRFKNIYCNSDRQYQPDIVMDIKLYGQR